MFDAYKVEGFRGEVIRWHNIDVVFTKEAETADQYIEKTAHVIGKKYKVTSVSVLARSVFETPFCIIW